jgi:hypothetical protein
LRPKSWKNPKLNKMEQKNESIIVISKENPKSKIVGFFGQEFFRNSLVHWVLIATIFLNVANWISLAVFIRPVDLPIVLHYNVFFGVDLIGDWWQVFLLPGVSDIFFIINTFMAFFFFKQKERIASYLFLLASLFIQFGIVVASASIILMNY